MCIVVALSLMLVVAGEAWAQALPAFPGAEGAGGTASGGRGYTVYHVTSLSDGGGPGTWRDAVSQSNRIIVFDVGGTIRIDPSSQTDHWLRTSVSNITIAGQTAPGDGIFIQGTGSKFTGSNVVIRNMTFRPGTWAPNPTDQTMDSLWLQPKDSIVDHCSAEWHGDEGITSSDMGWNSTVQYCIIAEGLNYNSHSYGGMIQIDVSNTVITYHHNLFADNKSRNPRLGNKTSAVNVTDFRDNVMYNWISNCGYSGSGEEGDGNFINNYYIAGPSTTSSSERSEAFNGGGTLTHLYQSGNKIDPDRDGVFDGTDTGWGMFTGTYSTSPGGTAFAAPTVYTQTADEALATVLNYAGANWSNRSATDTRIVTQVRSAGTTGAVINWVEDVGGWPYQQQVSRPAGWDIDQDGMPNTWEIAHGLDPSAASNNGDYDNDGYTNIEEYLNELAAWPAPKPIIWTGGTAGRYELITNWDIPWQPTLYDQAEINSGKATVGYQFQEAGTLYVGNTAASNGELAVTAGKLTVGNALLVAYNVNARGTISLSGGAISVGDRVTLGGPNGSGARGVLNVTGGSLTAGGAIILASSLSSTGELRVSRGAYVQAGGLTIYSGGARSTTVGVELDATGSSLIRTMGLSTLAGVLDVQSLADYRPREGDKFIVISSTDPNGVHFTGNF
ncbi:MAG: hypothetical protein MUP47_11005, partial [Phycisphaerae bacterium]|nr:hypothetical protein [Phycisphaerae bacterium]